MPTFGQYYRAVSIRSRLLALGMAIFLLTVFVFALLGERSLRGSITGQVLLDQETTVGLQATYIEQELSERFRVLETYAAQLTPDIRADSEVLQQYLQNRLLIPVFFNGGVAVMDSEGTVIAFAPSNRKRIGINYADRAVIQNALEGVERSASSPVIGKVLGSPIVVLAVPLRNPDGRVAGVLSGAVDLSKPNFFDEITDVAKDSSRYFLLVDGDSGLIITSTNKQQIMMPPTGADALPLSQSLWRGEVASSVAVNSDGVEVLASARPVKGTAWYMVAALPAGEAFAPIRAFQQTLIMASVVMLVLSGSLLWWAMTTVLAPLFGSIRRVAALASDPSKADLLPVARNDEIGALMSAFNRLLAIFREREAELQTSKFRWKFAIEGSGDGLWDWDMVSDKVFYSPTWKSLLGLADDDISDSLDEWKSRVHPDDLEQVQARLQAHIECRTDTYASEHRMRCKDGSWKWVLDRGVVVDRDKSNRPIRMIGTQSDITERRRTDELIRHLALVDPLTALPNRRFLEQQLDKAIASNKRQHCHGAIIFCDLDNFKPLNDAHGHRAGDLLLTEVARRLEQCIRATDTVSRIGGDEFVALVVQLNKELSTAQTEALGIAEKIRAAIDKPFVLELETASGDFEVVEHHCSASIGVALFDDSGEEQNLIIKRADEAMYRAKETGRNRVCL